jgi:hypothetical protein
MADIKASAFIEDEPVAFSLIVHGFKYDAVWKGGNVVWFFDRHIPMPYSPTSAISSEIINDDWNQQTLPKMVYESLSRFETEKREA